MANPNWVPTVNDLRVKLCYICREEEPFDKPDDPPRPWTHPCSCTLVAHESCLLQWIIAAQQNPDRAANALKCPQCGAKYELESKNPLTLRLMNVWNRSLARVGKIITVSIAGIVVMSFGAGMYALCTSYGAFAMQEFIGKDLYDQILTDDPAKWPWYAFLNLPLIPLSLIGARTPFIVSISPLVPLLSGWPFAGPVSGGSQTQSLFTRLTGGAAGSSQWASKVAWWPPSPGLVCALFPFVRTLYQVGRRRVTRWVMNTNKDMPTPRLWTVNEDGEGFLRIRMGDNADARQGQGAERAQGAGDAQEGDAQGQGRREQPPAVDLLNDPNEDAGIAAERTIRLSGGSMGRIIGGALILPTVSRLMGSLLLRLSAHSSILARILAVRKEKASVPLWSGRLVDAAEWDRKSSFERLSLILQRSWMGSRLWLESDPIWWRNALGLGLFIVTKDCLRLLHLWLAKQELESRHVKSRSFSGIDPRELDLVEPSERRPRLGA
ncbi:hypothetical protein DENSPDRAFT_823929 [Dentipellis sp. KUC8613]|nr:hypothetical protein DENSPDRAFT_823929 [Dentipellis sp. KUC8613]